MINNYYIATLVVETYKRLTTELLVVAIDASGNAGHNFEPKRGMQFWAERVAGTIERIARKAVFLFIDVNISIPPFLSLQEESHYLQAKFAC